MPFKETPKEMSVHSFKITKMDTFKDGNSVIEMEVLRSLFGRRRKSITLHKKKPIPKRVKPGTVGLVSLDESGTPDSFDESQYTAYTSILIGVAPDGFPVLWNIPGPSTPPSSPAPGDPSTPPGTTPAPSVPGQPGVPGTGSTPGGITPTDPPEEDPVLDIMERSCHGNTACLEALARGRQEAEERARDEETGDPDDTGDPPQPGPGDPVDEF